MHYILYNCTTKPKGCFLGWFYETKDLQKSIRLWNLIIEHCQLRLRLSASTTSMGLSCLPQRVHLKKMSPSFNRSPWSLASSRTKQIIVIFVMLCFYAPESCLGRLSAMKFGNWMKLVFLNAQISMSVCKSQEVSAYISICQHLKSLKVYRIPF